MFVDEIDWNAIFEYRDGHLYDWVTERQADKTYLRGYPRVRYMKHTWQAHQIIWNMHNGPVPEGFMLDHADGNPLNNNIENLRLATSAQNNWNKDRSKIQGGAALYVTIMVHGKTHKVGKFKTKEAAQAAYAKAAKKYFGEFYREPK